MRSDNESQLHHVRASETDRNDHPSSTAAASQVASAFSIGADREQANQAFNQKPSALLADIMAGQREALAQLYDQTSQVIYALALHTLSPEGTGKREAAEAVTMDVFMQVWQQAASYDSSHGTPLAWLITTTRRRALDRLRTTINGLAHVSEKLDTANQTITDDDSETANLFAARLLAKRCTLMRAALARLIPEQRLLIETAFYEGLNHSEMAARFQLPLGTVKTHVRDGLLALRQCLSETPSAAPSVGVILPRVSISAAPSQQLNPGG
ncbi:MAG: sigma-70 family RNA polymerase sigma factor [Acidobacteria bacterium]|nr:sigma-70 family RNA polymerase sigma factor [Acidobacteriota bacterium]